MTGVQTCALPICSNQAVSSQLRLRNITGTSTTFTGIPSIFTHNDDGGGSDQSGVNIPLFGSMSGRFTIGGATTYEIQNWITNALTGGASTGGKPPGGAPGENVVYLDLKVYKVG